MPMESNVNLLRLNAGCSGSASRLMCVSLFQRPRVLRVCCESMRPPSSFSAIRFDLRPCSSCKVSVRQRLRQHTLKQPDLVKLFDTAPARQPDQCNIQQSFAQTCVFIPQFGETNRVRNGRDYYLQLSQLSCAKGVTTVVGSAWNAKHIGTSSFGNG